MKYLFYFQNRVMLCFNASKQPAAWFLTWSHLHFLQCSWKVSLWEWYEESWTPSWVRTELLNSTLLSLLILNSETWNFLSLLSDLWKGTGPIFIRFGCVLYELHHFKVYTCAILVARQNRPSTEKERERISVLGRFWRETSMAQV